MSWTLIPLSLASVLFGFLGAGVTGWGVLGVKNFGKTLEAAKAYPEAPRRGQFFPYIWVALTLLAGTSMLFAAVLVWFRWELAVALGLWPGVLFAILWASIPRSVRARIRQGPHAD
ncbi:MAG: hypothetical protein ACHQ50_17055 [Fimbriimonadales bacterium]